MSQYKNINGDLEPLPDSVIITDIEEGMQVSKGGIIKPDDNGEDRGIRPRWARVYSVGKNVDYIKENQWVLVEHGRWSRGVENDKGDILRLVDNDSCMAVSDGKPGF